MTTFSLSQINDAAALLGGAEFSTQFPHPFLIDEDSQSSIDVESDQTMGLCYMPTQVERKQAKARTAYEVRAKESTGDEILLGRLPDSDVLVDDPSISKLHARLRVASDGTSLEVVDLGSTNGVFFKEGRVPADSSVVVKSGDIIAFGRVLLRFVSVEDFPDYLTALRDKGEL